MNSAFLLLAAALCVAPWRGSAAGRLRELDAGAGRGVNAPSRPAPVWRRAWGSLVGRLRPGPATPDDSGPLARMLDLLAVSLLAGLPTHVALAAVGDAMEPADPGVAAPLHAAAARVRLGATPAEAWRGVPGAGRVAPVAPVLARATDGGGSVRAALGHTAERMRADADAEAVTRAERAAVVVAGPLGLCFLPAFVCLGIVPVVIGLADGMLPGVLP